MNNFWNWLAHGQHYIPTLGGQRYISASLIENNLSIIAGNGTPQPLISRETVSAYIEEYEQNSEELIEGNKRYVIALYFYWLPTDSG